ncbi:MAG: GAF domain-containing protein [Bacteroidota bacterium]|nr:GAF domain-containing protein [Bacteroidota bacterium]
MMKLVDSRKNDIKSSLSSLNGYIDNRFDDNYSSFLLYYFIIFLVINALIFVIFYYIYRTIYSPWKKIQWYLKKMIEGERHKIEGEINVVELNIILETFNKYADNLEEKEKLIVELSKRNYSYEYTPSETDNLGNAISNLRDNLLESEKEAVKFQETEEHQKWTTNGIAKIGAVMRQHTNDLEVLSKNILVEILEYVNAIQGALYLYDKESETLKLSTYYSYGKQRIKKKEIKPYESILGIVLVEKREYYFADMPDDYLFFETGMGHAKPKSLFVFPLLFENEIYGIIELASLVDFKDYVKEFCLSLANEIAITISYTQINVQTNILLKQSESQAKNLISNEKLYKKNQDNLKSLLRMAEQKSSVKEDDLRHKEEILRLKVSDIISLEKEISDKEEYIETIVNEYENLKSSLENQNEELRKRIEDLEKRLRNC